MNQSTPLNCLSAVIATAALIGSASAAITFDANVTPNVIFGSGNTNGSFTVDQNNGVELGLRGKLRHNATGAPENTYNSNSDGTYSFAAGVAPTQSSPTAVWSFEWSINTNFDGSTMWNLADLTYRLELDSDPTQGTNFFSFDPIAGPFWDHSIGDNGTANGAGTEATDAATYAALVANNNVAQNSWKPHWFISPFDPTVDGTYDFKLTAYNGTTQVASTGMQVVVGQGGASVPDGGSMIAMLGGSLLGLGGFRRFLVKKG